MEADLYQVVAEVTGGARIILSRHATWREARNRALKERQLWSRGVWVMAHFPREQSPRAVQPVPATEARS